MATKLNKLFYIILIITAFFLNYSLTASAQVVCDGYYACAITEERDNKIDLFIASCSLPYVENPYNILSQIKLLKPKCFLINRMPVTNEDEDFCSVQYVNDVNLFSAKIPAWFFSEKKLLNYFNEYQFLKFHTEDQAKLNHKVMIKNYTSYIFF